MRSISPVIQFESSEAGNTAPKMEEWKTAGIPTMKPGLVYHDVEIAGRSQPPRSVLTLSDAHGEKDSLSFGVALACGLLRREGSRLALGVCDGAAAAGKPGDAGGQDDGEEHDSCCEAESDTLDEVAVGNRNDRLLRRRVQMFDRPAGPDLGRVSTGIRVPDDHIRDFLALGRIRKRVGEVGAEGGR